MKIFLIILGWICVALALAGIILPGLPATPFLLLASFAFARSSQRMHNWLVSNRLFGPILADFLDRKGIKLRYKIISIVFMWTMVLVSVLWLIDYTPAKYAALGGAVIGTIAVLRFKTL
jgi:hypothetical protein